MASPPQLVVNNFGYDEAAGGWRVERHPGFLADATSDGQADIVGLGVPVQQRFLTSTNPRRSVTCAPARLSSGDSLAASRATFARCHVIAGDNGRFRGSGPAPPRARDALGPRRTSRSRRY